MKNKKNKYELFRTNKMIKIVNFANNLIKTNMISSVCGNNSIPLQFTFLFKYFEQQSN